MKAFFEEYGLVLIVIVLATAMLSFSTDFGKTMQGSLNDMWDSMTEGDV
ncbi:MAG: hypothetical protein GX760_04345 [Erysipelothrix sp.]|nr:hypothetical protein [Erysipelothrix sp.]